jgi:succinoglycan biosynthesis protein ExoA
VCILAGHGLGQLEACLTSLRSQVDAPPFELLVGGERLQGVTETVRCQFPDAQVCHVGPLLPGAARNALTERAGGELLLFLDDDVTVPPDLLARLAQIALEHPGVSVFGGPNETPVGSSQFQLVQGAVLSSLIGTGPVSRRYGPRNAGPADERWFTLCNLAIRRRCMSPFRASLVCAEENALLSELRSRGERMRYDPGLRVFHARRPTLGSFAAQMFKYGRGRGQLLARDPRTARAPYFAPVTLLLYLSLLPALISLQAGPLYALAPGALYGALTLLTALRIGWTLRRSSAPTLAAILIPLLHVCYGAGILRGVFLPQIHSGVGRPLRDDCSWIGPETTPALVAKRTGTPWSP